MGNRAANRTWKFKLELAYEKLEKFCGWDELMQLTKLSILVLVLHQTAEGHKHVAYQMFMGKGVR
jgi:hypothetical protein